MKPITGICKKANLDAATAQSLPRTYRRGKTEFHNGRARTAFTWSPARRSAAPSRHMVSLHRSRFCHSRARANDLSRPQLQLELEVEVAAERRRHDHGLWRAIVSLAQIPHCQSLDLEASCCGSTHTRSQPAHALDTNRIAMERREQMLQSVSADTGAQQRCVRMRAHNQSICGAATQALRPIP